MDLKQLSVKEEPVAMEVMHPGTQEPLTDEKTGETMKIHLLGRDSQAYKTKMRERQNKRMQAGFKKGKNRKVSIEEVDSDTLEVMVAVTTDWEGVIWEGKPLEFNAENARFLYKNLPWLVDQVDEFIHERENFFTS